MRWISLCLLVACSNADGTRGQCAEGGELSACPEAERTPEGACWRLVDCGAIPLDLGSAMVDHFDWNACVGYIDGLRSDQQRVVVNCIAASTCDSLKPSDTRDPDPAEIGCLQPGFTP
jgi:hypothetical protein